MLSTRQLGGGHLSHEIFFWQGKESSQVGCATNPSTILRRTSFHIGHEADLHTSTAGTPQEHDRDMASAAQRL